MAREITVNFSATVSKSGASLNTGSLAKTFDMSGDGMTTGTHSATTSGEILSIPSIIDFASTALAHVVIKNLDSTNYVEVFQDSSKTLQISKLKPGEICFFNRIDTCPYVKANTAACLLQYWAWEE